MHRRAAVLVVTGVFFSGLTLRVGLAGGPAPAPAAPRAAAIATPSPAHTPDSAGLIDRYCRECPDDKPKKGGLTLASFDVAKADQHPEIGEKMMRKLSARLVAPAPGR